MSGIKSTWLRQSWLRFIGLALLAFLLLRLDIRQALLTLARVDLPLLLVVVVLDPVHVALKTIRWLGILRSQGTYYKLSMGFLAYYAGMFAGFLTPGRLGEFVRALHVSRDCGVSSGQTVSSVLADRLFDLYALLAVGGAALLSLPTSRNSISRASLLLTAALLTALLGLFLNDRTFGLLRDVGLYLGCPGRRLFAPGGWLTEMRNGLRQVTFPWLLVAIMFTIAAYAVFFSQCYMLALALKLKVGFAPISFAVALASLVTLLPISISGLGTREAAMIAYLGAVGVPAEAALGFSLLVFVTFHVGGALLGAVAWLIKPIRDPDPPERAPA